MLPWLSTVILTCCCDAVMLAIGDADSLPGQTLRSKQVYDHQRKSYLLQARLFMTPSNVSHPVILRIANHRQLLRHHRLVQ
jgi:hypothetical protein